MLGKVSLHSRGSVSEIMSCETVSSTNDSGGLSVSKDSLRIPGCFTATLESQPTDKASALR